LGAAKWTVDEAYTSKFKYCENGFGTVNLQQDIAISTRKHI